MVSTSKLLKAQTNLLSRNFYPYMNKIHRGDLGGNANIKHPMLERKREARIFVCVTENDPVDCVVDSILI